MPRRERIAYHEAGHAVAARMLPYHRAHTVTIEPGADTLGVRFRGGTRLLGRAYDHEPGTPEDLDIIVTAERLSEHEGKGLENLRIRKRLESIIMVHFAGAAADSLLHIRYRHWLDCVFGGALSDVQTVMRFAFIMVPGEEMRPYLDWLWVRTRRLLGENWPWVEAIAQELMQRGTLGPRELQEIEPVSGAIAPYYAAIVAKESDATGASVAST